MDFTDPQTASNTVYRQRLLQAKRVMLGLSEQQRVHNINMGIFAMHSDHGVIACIAGHCGLDPWFQERGFVTTVGASFGDVSMRPDKFFGTSRPFHPDKYPRKSVTFDDAMSALDDAIASFADDASEVVT